MEINILEIFEQVQFNDCVLENVYFSGDLDNLGFLFLVVLKRLLNISLSLILDNNEFTHTRAVGQSLLVILSWIAIVFSGFVFVVKNPIYALLSLILVFFSTTLMLIILNVEFLALIFLVIYIGAISILFLFVIMMFNLKKLQNQQTPNEFWMVLGFYIVFVPKTYYLVIHQINNFLFNQNLLKFTDCTGFLFSDDVFFKTRDILLFTELLYTYYSCVFILLGMLLLTALLCSIVLALSTLEE